jgi:hypothetical protein
MPASEHARRSLHIYRSTQQQRHSSAPNVAVASSGSKHSSAMRSCTRTRSGTFVTLVATPRPITAHSGLTNWCMQVSRGAVHSLAATLLQPGSSPLLTTSPPTPTKDTINARYTALILILVIQRSKYKL